MANTATAPGWLTMARTLWHQMKELWSAFLDAIGVFLAAVLVAALA